MLNSLNIFHNHSRLPEVSFDSFRTMLPATNNDNTPFKSCCKVLIRVAFILVPLFLNGGYYLRR